MLAEPLTGLVDTAFIAQLGSESLAALGVGTVVLSSGMWLFNFLSVGTQTEVSQASGRQQVDAARKFSSLALLFAVSAGLLLAVAEFTFAPLLSTAMGAADVVADSATTYIRLRSVGIPAVLVTMTSFGVLYGLADMRSPLVIAVTVNALNILLDGLLIFGIGPFPAMGIAGAALASSISQWVGLLMSCYVIRQRIGFTLDVDTANIKKLLKIGQDMFVRTGSLILFLLLATRAATLLGADAGAAHQAIRQVWVFTSLFLDASAITAQSIIGYNIGSGQVHRARKVAQLVCCFSLLIGFSLMAAMLSGSQIIAAILVPSTGLSLFYPAWTVSAILQPVAAVAFITDGIHWGTGDFSFLRNVVVTATFFGISGLLLMATTGTNSLTTIWWITGSWVCIRAMFGILRIWPGLGDSPLQKSALHSG